jgi:hypothetical protein
MIWLKELVMQLKILMFSILLMSCGIDNNNVLPINRDVTKTGNPLIDPWIEMFYQRAEAKSLQLIYSIRVVLKPDEKFTKYGDSIGLCLKGQGYVKVYLKESFFNSAKVCHQAMLIFHELGHCALNLEHTDSGLMAPYLVEDCETDDIESSLMDVLNNMIY